MNPVLRLIPENEETASATETAASTTVVASRASSSNATTTTRSVRTVNGDGNGDLIRSSKSDLSLSQEALTMNGAAVVAASKNRQ